MAQYRPEREKRPPCLVPAILPVFPYPGDNLPSRRVLYLHFLCDILQSSPVHTCSSQSKPGSETLLEARDPFPLTTELQTVVVVVAAAAAAVGREATLLFRSAAPPSAVWNEGIMISGKQSSSKFGR